MIRLPSRVARAAEQTAEQVGRVAVGLRRVDQPHRGGQIPEVVGAQVDQPQVAERRAEGTARWPPGSWPASTA